MGDHPHRKLPPDRPSDLLACGSNKKKRNESSSQADIDTLMLDDTSLENASSEHYHMDQENNIASRSESTETRRTSYKESLLGFNGIDNTGGGMEEDELMADILNKEWDMPELTEEIQKLMENNPVVPITTEEYSEWCKPWNGALILTVLGKRYNVYTLKTHLSRLWKTAEFDLIDLPNNYFIVRFSQKNGWVQLYQKVLYEGPWVVQQHTILVQRWSPNFDPFNNPLGRIVTWVRIPNIPMQCYNRTFITRLGNRIGKTVKVDMLTPSESPTELARVERGKYARICVELDLRKKLVPRVIAANNAYLVEYEGLNLICFECGRYGHRKDNCQWTYVNENQVHSSAPTVNSQSQMNAQPEDKGHAAAGDAFGPWMIVGRANRTWMPRKHVSREADLEQNTRGMRNDPTEKTSTVSRFNILAELNEEELIEEATLDQQHQAEWIPVNGRSTRDQEGTAREGRSIIGGEHETQARTRRTRTRKHGTGNLTPRTRQQSGSQQQVSFLTGPKQLGLTQGTHCQSGPDEMTQAQGNKANAIKSIGHKNKQDFSAGPGKFQLGHRDHVVVGGSVNKMGSSDILNMEEELKINGVFLLEGPKRISNTESDAFVKEKFEQSPGQLMEIGNYQPTLTEMEEDVGEDFQTIMVHDRDPQVLGEEGSGV